MKTIRYIGHKEEVYTVWNGSIVKFKRGIEKEIGAELAKSLLAQPEKFEEVI